jgi:hypothetical protein
VLVAKDAIITGDISKLIGKPVKTYKENCLYNSISAISGSMNKHCCKCKILRDITDFGKLKNSPDGLRYDCKICRNMYNMRVKEHVKEKNRAYYLENKESILTINKTYRETNEIQINIQRKQYRNRPEIKERVKVKNKEYLPIRKEQIKLRRKTDLNFQLSEVMRSKFHRMLKNQSVSYKEILGCDLNFLKKWIEFRFDSQMSWENFGEYWQIDHIIPIHAFNFNDTNNKNICFHWTNLQPLTGLENRSKSDNLQLHYYFNNIVNVNRFNMKYKQFLGYQAVNESLQWLKKKDFRYGNNPPYEDVKASEIGNPQPRL